MEFEQLRREYPVFSYDGFTVEPEEGGCRVTFSYTQSDDISFSPSWSLPVPYDVCASDPTFRAFVFNLGLVELVSYWKACCSPKVVVKCGNLCEKQVKWWKKLWFNGLGEFFYRNGITTDMDSFMTVCAEGETYRVGTQKPLDGNLICVGGGKDSCVTMALLRGRDNRLFAVNGSPAIFRTASAAGYEPHEMDVFVRRLDRRIVELNSRGFLNGHTPFSAVLAFSSVLCAYLTGRRYVVLSNESSANDVYVRGTQVNHQYSKSLEFENDFRAYVCKWLPCGVEYFSLLRPLNEWNIVKRFVREPAFLPAFLSCNLGTKADKWCCECPKCLFTFIMLAPFVDVSTLAVVFGKDLFNDPAQLKYLDGLCSEQFDKPFECIGTRAEINTALRAAVKKYGTGSVLLNAYKQRYGTAGSDEEDRMVDDFFDENNNVPTSFAEVLAWKNN